MLSKIARNSDLDAVENAASAVTDFFNFLHIEILGDKDRIRLLNPELLPMEVFPLAKLVRSLIELSELAKDENLRMELRDQVKRLQSYLSSLSEVIELKDQNSVYWLERGGRKTR